MSESAMTLHQNLFLEKSTKLLILAMIHNEITISCITEWREHCKITRNSDKNACDVSQRCHSNIRSKEIKSEPGFSEKLLKLLTWTGHKRTYQSDKSHTSVLWFDYWIDSCDLNMIDLYTANYRLSVGHYVWVNF